MSVAFRSIPYSTDGVLRCQLTWSTQSHANFLTLVAKLNMVKTNQTVCPKTSKRMLSKHALQQIILRLLPFLQCNELVQCAKDSPSWSTNMARVAWRGNLAIEAEREDPGNDNGIFLCSNFQGLIKKLNIVYTHLVNIRNHYFLAYFAKKGIKKFII